LDTRDGIGWLGSRLGRALIMVTSVAVVTAMKLPRVVGVAALVVINVGLIWYLLFLRRARD
jgi:hypothetical protein